MDLALGFIFISIFIFFFVIYLIIKSSKRKRDYDALKKDIEKFQKDGGEIKVRSSVVTDGKGRTGHVEHTCFIVDGNEYSDARKAIAHLEMLKKTDKK